MTRRDARDRSCDTVKPKPVPRIRYLIRLLIARAWFAGSVHGVVVHAIALNAGTPAVSIAA